MPLEYWGEWEQSIDPQGYKEYLLEKKEKQKAWRRRQDAELKAALENAHGSEVSAWPKDYGTLLSTLEGRGIHGVGPTRLRNTLGRLGIAHDIMGGAGVAVPMDIEAAILDWLRGALVANAACREPLPDLCQDLYDHFTRIGRRDRAEAATSKVLASVLRGRGDKLVRGGLGMMLLGYRLR